MFGKVQSERPVDDGLLSDVDVKNMLRRLVVFEESLKVEKQSNDELEKKVNFLTTNLKKKKRTFEDKCAAQ